MIETLFSRYYITQKTTNWTSNRIVIVQRKYWEDICLQTLFLLFKCSKR